jgi:plasmid maintenance system antidote protein VapI
MLSIAYPQAMIAPMQILDELRRAVKADPRSLGAIALKAGIHRKTFSAFMNGRRGLSVETVEELAKALRLTIKFHRRGE